MQIEHGSWSFWRITACFVVGSVLGAVGVVGGGFIGTTYGGQYAPNLELGGLRGYEATGMIGEVVGFVVVGLLSFYPASRITQAWPRPAAVTETPR